MTRYFAPRALLAEGWRHNVLIDVDEQGTLTALTANAEPQEALPLNGSVVPQGLICTRMQFSVLWQAWPRSPAIPRTASGHGGI